MIYVVTEDEGTPGARARNAHILAQAQIAEATARYGRIVSNHIELRQELGARDRMLYLFAHGNAQVVGRFSDMGDLVNHLRDHLRAFDRVGGTTLNEIFVNSCESQQHAGNIAGIVGGLGLTQYLTVVGTAGRSFTDTQGNVRVARDDEGADELDANTHRTDHRFQQMIDRNCFPAGEGLARWQV